MKIGQAARVVRGENWYIQQYEQYLFDRDPEREAAMIAIIMERPMRVRGWSWSASAAGRCLRERQFAYLGMPKRRPEAKTMNIFANGDYMHIRHQAFGMVAGYITSVEVPVAIPGLNLIGTMDGILSNGRGLELKSINTRGFSEVSTFGAKAEHIRQMHCYMLAADLDAFVAVYEDKNTQNIKEILVPRDEQLIKSVREELEELEQASNERTLLPMLQECRNGQGKFRWCDYRDVCEEARWPTSESKPAIRRTSSSDAS